MRNTMKIIAFIISAALAMTVAAVPAPQDCVSDCIAANCSGLSGEPAGKW